MSGILQGAAWWWLLALPIVRPQPTPALGPAQVIRTVVEALENNNSPNPNAGIFTVYQFASPGNRANTGPYGRFLQLVKNPAFAPLLTHSATEYGPLSLSGDRADQVVTLRSGDGQVSRFHFVVSRQTSKQTRGGCAGCWMVDQVNPL